MLMPSSTDNIEPPAHEICERDLRRLGMAEDSLSASVGRYWHYIAAYSEAGFVDNHNQPA
jgi:hypothetical protein